MTQSPCTPSNLTTRAAHLVLGVILLTFCNYTLASTSSRADICQQLGDFGEQVAGARKDKITQVRMLELLPSPGSAPGEREMDSALRQVVAYVFKNKLPEGTARETIYSKCLAGEFVSYRPLLD